MIRRIGQILHYINCTGGVDMPRTAKKKEYVVTVSYCEKTPEEAERVKREITAVLYEKKMLSLQRQKEKAERAAQEAQ